MASKGLEQAYEMQDLAHAAAMAMREQLKLNKDERVTKDSPGKLRAPDKDEAAIIGTLGKVWRDAQEQIRIHRGKPLPGSLTHEKVKRGARVARSASMLAERAADAQSASSDADATVPNQEA